jgi:hypothetical protein
MVMTTEAQRRGAIAGKPGGLKRQLHRQIANGLNGYWMLIALLLLLTACTPGPQPVPSAERPRDTPVATPYAPPPVETSQPPTAGPAYVPPSNTQPPSATPVPATVAATATATSSPLAPQATETPPPAGTPSFAVTPPLSVTLVPGRGPAIASFYAGVTYAQPGQAITLTWRSDGASAALYQAGADGRLGPAQVVPPSGALSYTVPLDALDAQRFVLFVSGADGISAEAGTFVRVPCPAVWFFAAAPPECPGGAALSGNGAEDHFEHGTMLWSEATGRIYVLYNDPARGYNGGPAWESFIDTWREGDPESDPSITPPPGLRQPIRGFGLVWRTQPGVRDKLGWATDPEGGYPQLLQQTARVTGNWLYVKALHDGNWALGPNGGPWHYVP